MLADDSDLEGRKQLLVQVFPSLSSEEIDELQRISLQVYYDEGELIAQEGSYAAGVYIVQSGLVSIGKYASAGWEKRVLRFLAVGEIFGLEAVLLGREEVNVQFAKALVEATLVFFERANLLAFRKEHPNLCYDLSRWLAREVIMLEFKLTREATESLDHNLALLLIALANKYGQKEDNKTILNLPVSRQTMAEMLGISIETLMRALKRFREHNLITTMNRQIAVVDWETLKERARTTPFYLSIIEETL